MRGLVYDDVGRRLFTCCLDDGKVYGYYLGANIQTDIEVDKLFTIQGEKGCREIVYLNRTNQIVVGHDSGIVSVYNIDQPKTPFYSRKVHNKDITKMDYLIDSNILLTASKDQSIKFWRIKHDKGETIKPVEKPKNNFNPFQNLEDDDDDPFNKNIKTVQSKKQEPTPVIQQPKPTEPEEDSDEDMVGWND